MKYRLLSSSLLLFTSLQSVAQLSSSSEQHKELQQVCAITVGAPAANIAKWESDSVFSFKATDEGAVPPMDLFYRNTDRSAKKFERFPFTLGISTPPILSHNPMVLYKHSGSNPESGYTSNFKIPLLDNTHLTAVVMWRSKTKPSWEEPNMMPIDASPNKWPSGQIRILNISPMNIGLTTKGGRSLLKPKQIYAQTVSSSAPYRYKIEAAINGKAVFVCNSAISMPNRGRKLVVIFGNQRGQAEAMVIQIPMPKDPAPTVNSGISSSVNEN